MSAATADPERLGLRTSVWFAVALALACDRGRSLPAAASEPPIDEGAFAHPWVAIDRVGSGNPIDAVTLGPTGYVALSHLPSLDGRAMPARNNIAAVSVDGVNWTERTIVPDGHYRSIAFGAGRYVAAGGTFIGAGGVIITSTDGAHWTPVWSAEGQIDQFLTSVRYTDKGFVALGSWGAIVTSVDGLDWRLDATADRKALVAAAQGNGTTVAVGAFHIAASRDNQTWTLLSDPCDGGPCQIVTAPDGTRAGVLGLQGVAHGAGVFLATGAAGLLRSPDGFRWEKLGAAVSDALVFAGGRFLSLTPVRTTGAQIVRYDLATSTDGSQWTPATTAEPRRSDLSCAERRCLLFPQAILLIP